MLLVPGGIAAMIGAHLYLVDPPRHHGAAVDAGQAGRPGLDQGMNQREKEEYLREYTVLKSQGKPFFPYAVAKDSLMACVVLLSIIIMSLTFGAELGPKADPTTTTYVPRPEWYFFFLFELLRVIKPAILTPLATIGVPTICIILLFLLPFVDRSPERRPERRPIATIAGIFTIVAMGYLTYLGAAAGSPNQIDLDVPQQTRRASSSSRSPAASPATRSATTATTVPDQSSRTSGTSCHKAAILRTLENPTAPMPPFEGLPEEKKSAMVDFLAQLRGE